MTETWGFPFFLRLNDIPLYVCASLFIHSCKEQLGCFQLLDIVNCVAMNIIKALFNSQQLFVILQTLTQWSWKRTSCPVGIRRKTGTAMSSCLSSLNLQLGVCSRERNQCDGTSGNQVLGRRNAAKLSQQPREEQTWGNYGSHSCLLPSLLPSICLNEVSIFLWKYAEAEKL